MANFRYFADVDGKTVVLDRVHHDGSNSSKAAAYRGMPVGTDPVFVPGKGWTGYVTATRVIEYKSNPSKHECDARCLNATGRIMKCECTCGGKNHGKGGFMAVAA